MCGLARPPAPPLAVEPPAEPPATTPEPTETAAPPIAAPVPPLPTQSTPAKQPPRRRSPRELVSAGLFWVVAALVAVGLAVLWLALRDEGPRVMAAFIPTTTPLPPTVTNTPTWTPLPSETPPPSPTPSPTGTPAPTSTPRESRFHTVGAGETLFGLSLLYRVSAESIAQAN